MDAGARAKRLLQRREYAAKVSGSEDRVPDDIRDWYNLDGKDIFVENPIMNIFRTLNQRRKNNAAERNKTRDLQGNEIINGVNSQLLNLSPGAQKRFRDATSGGSMNNNSYEPEGEMVEANAEQMKAMHDAKMRKKEDDMKKKKKVDEACWKGYEKKGMKTMFGKRYPNCVKKTKKEEVQLEAKVEKFAPKDKKADVRNRRRFGKKHNKSIYGMENGKMLYRKDDGKREDNTKKRRAEHEARRGVKGAVPKKTKTVPKKKYKGIVTVGNVKRLESERIASMKKEEVQLEAKKSCGEGEYYCHDMKKCKPIPDGMKVGKDGMLVKEAKELKKAKINFKTTKRGGKTIHHVNKNDESDAQRAMKNDPKYILGKTRVKPMKEDMKGMSQKSGDKRSTESGAGMTAKGVAKYNRRTGGNLKTAVTTPPSKLKAGSKAANRRKSFCARSKSWTGPRGKAARRRWNCSYEPELPMIIDEKKKLYNSAPLSDRVAAWTNKISEGLTPGRNDMGLPNLKSVEKKINKLKTGRMNTGGDGTAYRGDSYIPQGDMIERKMTTPEKKKKEDYVKGMKKDKKGFTKRYGKDAKSVMYATATKMAMKKEEVISELDNLGGPTALVTGGIVAAGLANPIVNAIKGFKKFRELQNKKTNKRLNPTFEAKEEKKKSVKGIAKELDKAVAMHKSQAKRLRSAGVSEDFYQKRYAGVGKGYQTVGKNKRMDQSNKRGGDSKKQNRELHTDLVKYGIKKKAKSSNLKKALKSLKSEGNLHSWFKGSKSKDGKGGWVNVVTGGTCASDKPGEGTPKCVSSSKRASMTKAERLSASRRKKKADPGQQSKSGAAKPTYVATDSKKKK